MIVVTRNVRDKIRGFLSSSMLEIEAGIYLSSNKSPSVRNRIIQVLESWINADEFVLIVFIDNEKPGKLSFKSLGKTDFSKISLKEVDGILLSFKKSHDFSIVENTS